MIFHLAKHGSTETTFEYLFCDGLDSGKEVDDMNKTMMTECSAFMVRSAHDVVDVEVYG